MVAVRSAALPLSRLHHGNHVEHMGAAVGQQALGSPQIKDKKSPVVANRALEVLGEDA